MKKHRDKRSDRKYIATGQVVAYDGGVPRILGGYVPRPLRRITVIAKRRAKARFRRQ